MGGEFLLNLNITERPIANKYREGKLQRTLKRELKDLKPPMGKDPVQGTLEGIRLRLSGNGVHSTALGSAVCFATIRRMRPTCLTVLCVACVRGQSRRPSCSQFAGGGGGQNGNCEGSAGLPALVLSARRGSEGAWRVVSASVGMADRVTEGSRRKGFSNRGAAAMAGSPVLKHGPRSQACARGERF